VALVEVAAATAADFGGDEPPSLGDEEDEAKEDIFFHVAK